MSTGRADYLTGGWVAVAKCRGDDGQGAALGQRRKGTRRYARPVSRDATSRRTREQRGDAALVGLSDHGGVFLNDGKGVCFGDDPFDVVVDVAGFDDESVWC
jgi:hypothetical protein